MNALPGLTLAGDLVLAPWAEDGFDYEATLEEVDEALTAAQIPGATENTAAISARGVGSDGFWLAYGHSFADLSRRIFTFLRPLSGGFLCRLVMRSPLTRTIIGSCA